MNIYDKPRPTGYPSWFDLMSPDVKKAASFYESIFGWNYQAQGAEFNHYHMAFTQDRSAAGIGQMPEDSQFPSAWTVYYATDDVKALSEKAQSLGATIMNGPFEVPGQGHMAIIQDPTGAVFGLWEPINHIGAGITDVHGAMTWCEVNTPDSDKAKSFYAALFDANPEPLEDPNMTYYMLKKGEATVGGILQMDEQWEGVPPHWMAYFQVNDTDQTVKNAEAAGGKVSVKPFDTPFGRIAVLNDPYGAVFSIIQPPQSA